jgi:predicted PurR-regulated permease PerM
MQQSPKTPHEGLSQTRAIVVVLGWSLAAAIAFWFFAPVKFLLLGVLAASAMAALLRPAAQRIPGPRGLAAVVVAVGAVLVAVAVIACIGWFLAEPIQSELANWPQSKEKLNDQLQIWSSKLGVDQPPSVDRIVAQSVNWIAGQGTGLVSGTAAVLVDTVVALAFVFIGSMYILAEPPGHLTEPAIRILSPANQKKLRAALNDLEPRLRGWLRGTLVGMLLVGVAAGIGYKIVGLTIAIPLALFSGVVEIVPTVGPITALIVAVFFAAVQGRSQVVGVIIVYVIVQSLEAYVILPLIMRRAVNVPPIITLFTVVLWGKVFGIAGLLLAIPIDLTIWSLVRHFLMHDDVHASV